MFDASRAAEHLAAPRQTLDPGRPAPGKQTLLDQGQGRDGTHGGSKASGGESLFGTGALPWSSGKLIATDEGEQLLAAMRPSPERTDDGDHEEPELEAREADADVDGEAELDDGGGKDVTAPRVAEKRRSGHRVPTSRYATEHGKVMRNFRFKSGTRVSNTVGGDFGAPNSYKPSKVERFKHEILHTVSVDIGTVVGGKKPKFLSGWVLVFHKTYVRRHGDDIKVDTGDHTGWIKVSQLGAHGRASVAKHQRKLRRRLAHGAGAGHRARIKGKPHTFDIKNNAMLDSDKVFRIKGGSGSTPLGNYTHRPDRYGDVIIGTWNPPGSGAGGARFGGSGGIRAFLPLTQQFYLCDVAPMHVTDTTGTGTSTWRYVRANVNHERIYCWVLQRWSTRTGSGQNF